jgi:hypothetical protein
MNCFNHTNIAAVGVCKCCYRGLCSECTTDLGHGIACKGKHENEVTSINMIIEKNAQIYGAASKNSLATPIFYLAMGLVFAGYGLFSNNGARSFSIILGSVFIVWGIVVWKQSKKLFPSKK